MMFFDKVLEEPDKKRIVLRVLNMILKKLTCTFYYFFLFMDPDSDFCRSGSRLRKKSPIRIRTKRSGSKTLQKI